MFEERHELLDQLYANSPETNPHATTDDVREDENSPVITVEACLECPTTGEDKTLDRVVYRKSDERRHEAHPQDEFQGLVPLGGCDSVSNFVQVGDNLTNPSNTIELDTIVVEYQDDQNHHDATGRHPEIGNDEWEQNEVEEVVEHFCRQNHSAEGTEILENFPRHGVSLAEWLVKELHL